MANLHFDFVLLDECSQLTEPASLMPLVRLSCERLLAVGDPMQLPPTLLTPSSRSASSADSGGGKHDGGQGSYGSAFNLSLTLFERLARRGIRPVMLRAQYRCHPAISSLASRLFYSSQLVDGLGDAASAQRAPLVDLLPTVGFMQVCHPRTRALHIHAHAHVCPCAHPPALHLSRRSTVRNQFKQTAR